MTRLLFCLLVLVACGSAQDATSTIVCGDAATSPKTPLTECTLNVMNKGSAINAKFELFEINGGSGDATVTGVNPPAGTSASSFKFLVTVGAVTGYFDVVSGKFPAVKFPYAVYDTPDGTSTLVCDGMVDKNYLMVSKTANCSVVPMQNGKAIYTQSTTFVPAPTDYFTFSAVVPATIANAFSFTATAKSTSTVTSIGEGFGNSWNTTIINIPDATSTLACSNNQVQVHGNVQCTLTPKNSGNVIYTNAKNYNISGGNPGTVNPKISGYSNSFNDLTWTVGEKSGIYYITDGLNKEEIDIWDIPDATTALDCANTGFAALPKSPVTGYPLMGVGGTFNCLLYPSKGSAQYRIYTLPTVYSVYAQDKNGVAIAGSYDPVSSTTPGRGGVYPDSVSNLFRFSITGRNVYKDDNYIQIDTNVANTYNVEFVALGTPDGTSVLECANKTVDAGDVVDCSLTTYKNKSAVFVSVASIKMTDGDNGGKISELLSSPADFNRDQSLVHYHFEFTYKAGPHNRAIVLSDAFGNKFNLRVVGGTDPMSTGVIVAIVLGSLVFLGVVAWCCRKKGSGDENAPLLGD